MILMRIFTAFAALALLAGLAQPVRAQNPSTGFVIVRTAPSGACAVTSLPRLLVPNGTIYTCQNGIWAAIGGSGGPGTVTSVGAANGLTSTPNPFTTSGIVTGVNAAADGSTKGVATFTASDFNSATGNISLDYLNGQKATSMVPGFLSAADWTTFNNKVGTAYNQTIQDEGSSVTQRSIMNFVGAGVTVADSGGKTTVTIPGGGSSGCATSGSANGVLVDNGAGGCTTSAVTIDPTAGRAGGLNMPQGTACTPAANSTCRYAPTSISTAYGTAEPIAVGTSGVRRVSVSGQVATESNGPAVSADLNITTTPCSNQFVRSISSGAVGTCASIAQADLPSTTRIRGLSFTVGDPTNSSALTTSYTAYFSVPFACTISAYDLLVDATDTTLRVKFWKVATGTAIPTVSNSISTNGLGVPSGTNVKSTTLSDFTTTTVTKDDIMAMNVSVANTAKMVNAVLQCDQ